MNAPFVSVKTNPLSAGQLAITSSVHRACRNCGLSIPYVPFADFHSIVQKKADSHPVVDILYYSFFVFAETVSMSVVIEHAEDWNVVKAREMLHRAKLSEEEEGGFRTVLISNNGKLN